MARTTIDLADPILKDLKRLQAKEGKTLGQLVSELLAQALALRKREKPAAAFHWNVAPGHLLVDLLDKEAVTAILDEEMAHGPPA